MTEDTTEKDEQIGRLAMRQEGDYWNAYFAQSDTMEGSILLGSLHMGCAMADIQVKDGFMEVMRQAAGNIISNATGITPGWSGVEDAPEHEKAGHC